MFDERRYNYRQIVIVKVAQLAGTRFDSPSLANRVIRLRVWVDLRSALPERGRRLRGIKLCWVRETVRAQGCPPNGRCNKCRNHRHNRRPAMRISDDVRDRVALDSQSEFSLRKRASPTAPVYVRRCPHTTAADMSKRVEIVFDEFDSSVPVTVRASRR